jgi:hypothetical protein
MNCNDVESPIVEIARRRPVDAALARRVEAHVAACDGCRQRLEDERLVTEHLTALRGSLAEVRAPDALEGSLVAAFRQRRAAAPVPAASRATFRRWWLGAVAAVALVAVSVAAARWLSSATATPDSSAARSGEAAAPIPVSPVPPGAPVPEAQAATRPEVDEEQIGPRPARNTGRRRAALAQPQDGEVERVAYASLPAALPRWSDAPLVPVRLQVPYAALPALGLQSTREQWGESVPVEVLVGEDGIARGIRLVRYEAQDR